MNNSLAHHSNQTECPSAVPATMFTVTLSIISLLAVSGNFHVTLTFLKTTNLKTSPNFYIVNMAISDLVSVVLNWPLYTTEGMLKPGGSLVTDEAIGTTFCKLGIYSRAVSYVVSIESLVLIVVDRFTAIVFPLKAISITARVRAIFLLLSWFVPLLGVVPYLVYSEVIKVGQQTFCRNLMSILALQIYHFLSFTLFYFAPLILILVLYPFSVKHLKRRVKFYHNNKTGSARAKRLKENQNVMKIFKCVTLGFFICWTPLYIYMLLKALYPSIFAKDKCLFFVGLLYYIFPLLSTAINPFILIAFSSKYRAAIKDLCYNFSKKCRHESRRSVSAVEQIRDLQELT